MKLFTTSIGEVIRVTVEIQSLMRNKMSLTWISHRSFNQTKK
jgi:hypothetical protein